VCALCHSELSTAISEHLRHEWHGIEFASLVERQEDLIGAPDLDELAHPEIQFALCINDGHGARS
jgi:hypothetical protein